LSQNLHLRMLFLWFRAYRNKPYNSLCFLMISSRKGVNREAIGRQKWDPGETNVKIHIVLEVKSNMYENMQKYFKMCKIENHINYCVFLMILNFWVPAFRPTIAQTLISIDWEILPLFSPGFLGILGILRKWCQEVLLRPHLHTRRGSGWRELHKLPQIKCVRRLYGSPGVRMVFRVSV
jgi:hypothetical protein